MATNVRSIVEEYWRAEETRDLGLILAHYNSDAELMVPGMGWLKGHDEIKAFYEPSILRFPSLKVDILRGFENPDQGCGAFEWRATFVDHDGGVMVQQGVNVVTTGGGKLKEMHVYYDTASSEVFIGAKE